MPDVGVPAVVVVAEVAVVAAVELLWLLPPQPASMRAANAHSKNARLNPTPGSLERGLSTVNDDHRIAVSHTRPSPRRVGATLGSPAAATAKTARYEIKDRDETERPAGAWLNSDLKADVVNG